MPLQHLRSSTANKRPTPAAMSDGQIALNTQAGSPGLFLKDSAGGLAKVGPVHVGTTAPNVVPASGGTSGNSAGEGWLDTSGANPVLKIWSGSAWVSVNSAGGTGVTTADVGTVTSTMIADSTLLNIDINASAAIAHSKLANITAGSVLLGSASNVPTSTALSGDVTVSASGVTAIGTGVIVNTDVSASAAIAHSKLATLTAGQVILGNVSNVPTATAITGDVTITSGGVTAIETGAVVNADINASAAIVDTKLATISTTGKVSNSATTATSLNTLSAIVARDGSGNFSAGTITATLNGNASTATTVTTNANLTGDITSVGNATAIASGVIVNADINASAAIVDTKLATISTAGKVSNSATTATDANTASAIVARSASGNFDITSINNGPLAGFRNAIINGNFDHWQRGTSQATAGYGSADRWYMYAVGGTFTASRQSFALGQTAVPGEPAYFHRTVTVLAAGTGNERHLTQAVEDVRTFAGQQLTVSFWAKADAAKNISIEFEQIFGTGGSPSAIVDAIGVLKVALTTSWQKITRTVSIPSISGKTLGTDGNSKLHFNIWFDAGSALNARTDSLGQQSGTFDIAQVQLEPGPVATTFERRPIGTELSLCQRYYQGFGAYYLTYTAGNGTGFSQTITFPAMRTAPTVTISSVGYLNAAGIATNGITKEKLYFGAACNNAGAVPVSVAATLELTAEL